MYQYLSHQPRFATPRDISRLLIMFLSHCPYNKLLLDLFATVVLFCVWLWLCVAVCGCVCASVEAVSSNKMQKVRSITNVTDVRHTAMLWAPPCLQDIIDITCAFLPSTPWMSCVLRCRMLGFSTKAAPCDTLYFTLRLHLLLNIQIANRFVFCRIPFSWMCQDLKHSSSKMTFFLFDAIRGTFSSKQTHGANYSESCTLYLAVADTLCLAPF